MDFFVSICSFKLPVCETIFTLIAKIWFLPICKSLFVHFYIDIVFHMYYFLKLISHEKFFLHWMQLYNFSSVWVLMCFSHYYLMRLFFYTACKSINFLSVCKSLFVLEPFFKLKTLLECLFLHLFRFTYVH